MDQEGRFSRQRQHSLLYHGTLHIVVLDDDVLLQNFDCVQLVSAFPLRQHHLPEGSLPQNHQEIEILRGDGVLPSHVAGDLRVRAYSLRLQLRLADQEGLDAVRYVFSLRHHGYIVVLPLLLPTTMINVCNTLTHFCSVNWDCERKLDWIF